MISSLLDRLTLKKVSKPCVNKDYDTKYELLVALENLLQSNFLTDIDNPIIIKLHGNIMRKHITLCERVTRLQNLGNWRENIHQLSLYQLD